MHGRQDTEDTAAGTCAFPGCPEPPRPRVPGRSGPPPRYCTRPDHDPETARRARVRAAVQQSSAAVAGTGALAADLPPEGRVRQLVGRWAAAARDAAGAAEAQAALLTAALEALEGYRDDTAVEARLAQARSDVDAAHAALLRAEEQARLEQRLRTEAEEARQAADRDAADARTDAARQVAEARDGARRATTLAEEAQRAAEAAREEAEAGRDRAAQERAAAEERARDAGERLRAAERDAAAAREAEQRARADAGRDHDALVAARAGWAVTEAGLTEVARSRAAERDAADAARDAADAARDEARADAAAAREEARDAARDRDAARRAERDATGRAAAAADRAAAAERSREEARTDAARALQRAEDAERRAAAAEAAARAAGERIGALTAEAGALRARLGDGPDARPGR